MMMLPIQFRSVGRHGVGVGFHQTRQTRRTRDVSVRVDAALIQLDADRTGDGDRGWFQFRP